MAIPFADAARSVRPAHHPPVPATLRHLRPVDAGGLSITALAVSLTVAGLVASTRPDVPTWLVGQVILAFAMVQWFAILHEAGHETLFRTRWLNRQVGRLAGFFAGIPFHCWKRVHGRHHWLSQQPSVKVLWRGSGRDLAGRCADKQTPCNHACVAPRVSSPAIPAEHR